MKFSSCDCSFTCVCGSVRKSAEAKSHRTMTSDSCSCKDDGQQAPVQQKKSQYQSPQWGSIRGRHGEALDLTTLDKYTTKLFRKTLQKIKVQHMEKVLVCYSGGLCSTALLHLLDHHVPSDKRWKAHFEYDILFIAMSDKDLEEKRKKLEEQLRQKYPNIGEIFFEKSVLLKDASSSSEAGSKLFSEASAREDFVRQTTQKQIIQFAQQHGYGKVFLGHSANRLAIRVLGDISKGRGTSIPLMISHCDERLKSVKLCRPLKEFLNKELAYYVCLHRLKMIHQDEPVTMKPVKTHSIDRLIETFVEGLQRDFPSTVHTILRTCEKLKPPQTLLSEETKQQHKQLLEPLSGANHLLCPLCGTVVSRSELHETLENQEHSNTICCYACKRNLQYYTPGEGSSNNGNSNDVSDPLASRDPDTLPGEDIFDDLHAEHKALSRDDMRNMLKDVLLDDDEEE